MPRHDRDRRAEETALLATLCARQADLQTLVDASSDHWGYEDPIYRFYHQSFKVFALQQQTTAIVHALTELPREDR